MKSSVQIWRKISFSFISLIACGFRRKYTKAVKGRTRTNSENWVCSISSSMREHCVYLTCSCCSGSGSVSLCQSTYRSMLWISLTLSLSIQMPFSLTRLSWNITLHASTEFSCDRINYCFPVRSSGALFVIIHNLYLSI